MSDLVGSFYLRDSSPSLLIAGGMGITPFWAIVKQLEVEASGVDGRLEINGR
jgi:ferredoxin-NADP reductase